MKSAKIVPATAAQSWLFPKISANPLFTLAEKRRFYRPKLPALRAEVDGLAQKSAKPFLLLRRLRLLSLPKIAHSRPDSALGVPATLPHGGATCGFEASGGYALGCAAKAAQTADTGATARKCAVLTSASPVLGAVPPETAAHIRAAPFQSAVGSSPPSCEAARPAPRR